MGSLCAGQWPVPSPQPFLASPRLHIQPALCGPPRPPRGGPRRGLGERTLPGQPSTGPQSRCRQGRGEEAGSSQQASALPPLAQEGGWERHLRPSLKPGVPSVKPTTQGCPLPSARAPFRNKRTKAGTVTHTCRRPTPASLGRMTLCRNHRVPEPRLSGPEHRPLQQRTCVRSPPTAAHNHLPRYRPQRPLLASAGTALMELISQVA